MSPDCHHTEFHTPAYEFVDAEVLLVWIRACADQQYIPQAALNVLLHPAAQPINRPDNKIDCVNPHCFTKANQHTQGNRNCITYLCGPCCKNARIDAINSNSACPKCNAHKQAAATPTMAGQQPVTAYHPAPPMNIAAVQPPPNLPGPANNQLPFPPYLPPSNSAAPNNIIDPILITEQPRNVPA